MFLFWSAVTALESSRCGVTALIILFLSLFTVLMVYLKVCFFPVTGVLRVYLSVVLSLPWRPLCYAIVVLSRFISLFLRCWLCPHVLLLRCYYCPQALTSFSTIYFSEVLSVSSNPVYMHMNYVHDIQGLLLLRFDTALSFLLVFFINDWNIKCIRWPNSV